jgi:exonuclease III
MGAEPCSDFSFLSWNVRDLNNLAKREDVKQIIQIQRPMVVCLQETKLVDIFSSLVTKCLGPTYVDHYCYLPAYGTWGGILLASKEAHYQFSYVINEAYTFFGIVLDCRTQAQWSLTGVYGLQGNIDKHIFLRELRDLKGRVKPSWIIMGDFNLIYLDEDKNNKRLNRCLMSHF